MRTCTITIEVLHPDYDIHSALHDLGSEFLDWHHLEPMEKTVLFGEVIDSGELPEDLPEDTPIYRYSFR